MRAELEVMKLAGAGGAEVAAFKVRGPDASDPEFLAEYGWGTPRWTDKVQTMLETADDLDLALDLTIGPRWPAVVPTVDDINDPSAAQELVFGYEFGAGGSTRTGQLPSNLTPEPPSGADTTLIAALVARCSDADCDEQESGPRMLDRDSVRVVTDEVGEEGTLDLTFPGQPDETYVLITFLQAPSGESRSNLTATSPNYYLDYLSPEGLRASTDFWDEEILTPEVRQAIGDVGRVDVYEDSLELGSSQKWTWDFAEQWEQRRGYSPIRLLPAIADAGPQGLTDRTAFDFEGDIGDRVRRDYRQTWSDLYRDVRVKGLDRWAEGAGMSVRAQPYGGPVDTADVATYVDVPEGESLAFNHNIEDYKLLAVGAHRSGSTVVSNECCATRERVWDTRAGGATDPGNLQAVYRGYAGGVNQVVWHGYPHLTQGPDGTSAFNRWPGMTYGGNSSFAEAFGAKGGPNWADYRQINDNLARLQLVLRQGSPRYDVGVYWQDYGMTGHGTTGAGSDTLLKSTSPLAKRGFTYEYVSPAHLARDDAKVREGRLFPESSQYRALVLKDQGSISLDTARTLGRLVRHGFRIVAIGDLPNATPGYRDAAKESRKVRDVMADIARSPRVVTVADESAVPAALARWGIDPAASHGTPSADVLSVRREDATTNYYYLFNQSSAPAEQELTLEGPGRPYALDTWTGEIEPITDYRRRGGKVVVDVALAAADTKVIAISTRRDDTFSWRRGPHHAGGQSRGAGPRAIAVTDWDLEVESWSAGPSGRAGDTAKEALPSIAITAADDGTLAPWSEIDKRGVDLTDVSGVGTYTATVRLDDKWQGVREAYLDLGSAVDTVRVTVNGHDLGLVDPQDLHHVAVGRYLMAGDNKIEVRVASTLLNAVRVTPDSGASGRQRADYGLLGPVLLAPYEGRRQTLYVEALDRRVPLATGGANRVRVRIHNGSRRTVRASMDTRTAEGVRVIASDSRLRIPGGESVTTELLLRGSVASGTTPLTIDVAASNGTSGHAKVVLEHGENLALNTTGSPYPRTFASSNQDRYTPSFATDGLASTFWVSGGRVAGQGPTSADPEFLGVDLGATSRIRAVANSGRGAYGPKTYDVQTSTDGHSWNTVATVDEAPQSGAVTSFEPTTARYVRLRITDGWYPTRPGNNTQVREFAVYSDVENLARIASASASSTHSRFSVFAINDGSIAGQMDYSVWNAG
ncbi:MAG: discoidin domain-containing protein, partial [Actinomycetia bacterium]|nr:discoidin domain-containing protein [Actinomycetes bacterium]